MQSQFEMTEGQRRLRSMLDGLPSDHEHWNEAQNRFQFVDRLLTECLGWEHPNISVEHRSDDGGIADYILGDPGRAVVEAKRSAKTFGDLPAGRPSVVKKIEPLVAASEELKQAMQQVIRYCSLQGIQLAVVCNGPQMAIFQAITPGTPPLQTECFFFNGFESYISNFALLWTLLSPEGVAENRANRQISLQRNPRLPDKASVAISEPFRHRYRSGFQEEMRSLAALLLDNIEDQPELRERFYEQCYVPIEANNRHLLLSKQIIGARYRRVGESSSPPSAIDTIAKLDGEDKIRIDSAEIVDGSTSRPVVVVGDVGVGKSSFFNRLYVGLSKDEKSKTIFIHINLGSEANLSGSVREYVISAIPRVLLRDYNIDTEKAEFVNAIYHGDIRRFESGVVGKLKGIDPQEYNRRIIDFLSQKVDEKDNHLLATIGHLSRGQGKQIILIMDNADQRDIGTQEEAFRIAQELASTRNMIVFVSLRPSTFYESKARGALSAYQNKIFTILPPPADEVIQRRLAFALNIAEGRQDHAALKDIRIKLDSIAAFIRATLRAVRSNESIRQFLSNITAGNTRSVIELVTSFFGSPNVDAEKIVEIESRTDGYNVPLHEFTKHALLGEYSYFNPLSSLYACNVFDVSASDPREHFLSCLIIAYLSSNLGIKDGDGFVLGTRVTQEMSKNGFIVEQTQAALRKLAETRLIETPHGHLREIRVVDETTIEEMHYRATSVGIYHIRFWVGSFSFIDATSTDTPIFNEEMRRIVFQYAGSFSIEDRYKRACAFRDYLKAQWSEANLTPNYYDFSAVLRSQADSFDTVEAVVNHRPKPRPKRRRAQGLDYRYRS